ncbi:MAG TPA: DUF6152 family protein, partial [Hyphomonadaceae bacterium]|nr:DUF6152 family protein [Hyphomonadaceae bacterium]
RFLADARAGLAGPAVAGVFVPRIITPADFEDRFEKSERDVILAHEKIHLANNDARINALVALLRCACWFNPFVHIAAHLMRIDQELACDATVVERHPKARATYASALLKAQLASRPLPLGCYWPAGTEHPLTERVEMLKQEKPTRLRRRIGIGALGLLAVSAGATAWAVLPPVEHTRFEAPAIAPPVLAREEFDEAQPPTSFTSQTQPAAGDQPGATEGVSAPALAAHDDPQPAPTAPPAPQINELPWILQDRADPEAPLDLRGVVERVEWINPATRIHVREDRTGKAWVIETSTPNTLLRLGATKASLQEGTPITARGFAPIDKACAEACVMYAHPAWMTASGRSLSGSPPQATAQPIRYEPQQAPATEPPSLSQQLPPPAMRQRPRPVPESVRVGGAPPAFGAGTPVYVRGNVERIEFGDTNYVVFLRASSIARFYGGDDSHFSGAGAGYPNSDLWELSPTNYFGDRDSIRADLMGKEVGVNGVKTTECQPACRIRVRDLVMPRSSQVPQPDTDISLITQFGLWYDTTSPIMVRGAVERIEFSDKTFDAYVRSQSQGPLPARLYQVRSEYRFPREDIERELLNKTVVVTGWRAREGINTFCDPVCGIFAMSFQVPGASGVTPSGAQLTPAYAQRPRGPLFLSIADLTAPITITGKVLRYVRDAAGENPQLWIETTSVTPGSTFGSAPGTTWVVAGYPFDASDDWLNHTVTVRGFNVEDKRCQPQCLMAGDSFAALH